MKYIFCLLVLLSSVVYAYDETQPDVGACSASCPAGVTPNCTCNVDKVGSATTTTTTVYGARANDRAIKIPDNTDKKIGDHWCLNKVDKTAVEKGVCNNEKIKNLDAKMNFTLNGKKAPIELILSRLHVRDAIDMKKPQAASELYTWYVVVNNCLEKERTDCFPQSKQPRNQDIDIADLTIGDDAKSSKFTITSGTGTGARGQISNQCNNGGGFESLNSGNPLNDAEIILCNMKSLIPLDKKLQSVYTTASSSKKKTQREWLEDVRNKALLNGDSESEIKAIYIKRINYLED